jgi:predicted aspartyl protease
MPRKLCILICAGLLAYFSGKSAHACKLVRVAELPLVTMGGHYGVMARIDQVTRLVQVDTGAAATIIDLKIAKQLHLRIDRRHSSISNGIGNFGQVRRNVIPSTLAFGSLIFHDRSTRVAPLTLTGQDEQQSIGLLGGDILSKFDVEFDFPSKTLSLYHAAQCSGRFAPWFDSYQAVALRREGPLLAVDAGLNGQLVEALIDTGAPNSVISRRAATRIGVKPETMTEVKGKFSSGLNTSAPISIKAHRFDTMTLGSQTFPKQMIIVADVAFRPGDMLAGLDLFRRRKIWISYSTNQIFIAGVSAATPYFPSRSGPINTSSVANSAARR